MYKFNKQEMTEDKSIRIRTVEVLELADGTTRDGGYHSKVYTPDMNIEDIDCPVCKSIAQAVWTTEVVDAYKAKLAENELPAE